MATKPLSDLTATWNAGGTTFTAIKMNVTDTASAAGSLLLDLQVGGSSIFNIGKTGTASTAPALSLLNATMWVPSGGALAFSSAGNTETWRSEGSLGIGFTSSALLWWSSAATGAYSQRDTILTRDAANTLAQRNGTAAQTFRIYNTYTDASNYERGAVTWAANVLEVGAYAAGTGLLRTMTLKASQINFDANGSIKWFINSSGHILANGDNTYDIGASNATRPRNVHIAGYVSIGDGITAPGAGTGQARIYVDTADGDLKVVFADGTIKTIVTDT